MTVLGEEVRARYSMSSHFVMRWQTRIKDEPRVNIIKQVQRIMSYGRIEQDETRDDHYKIIHEQKCIVVIILSPLHHLLKTVMTI